MKRKEFQKPEATVTRFNAVDIVTASGDQPPKDTGNNNLLSIQEVQVDISNLTQ